MTQVNQKSPIKKYSALQRSFKPIIRVIISALVAITLPLVLDALKVPFISHSYSKEYQLFELFGFSAGIVLLINMAWNLRKVNWHHLEDVLQVLLPFGMALFFLFMISEYSIPSWDYHCYQGAAENILLKQNPYSSCYLYPPLLAQALATLSRMINACAAIFTSEWTSDNTWRIVFYLYQCIQFILVLATYTICVKFAQRYLSKLNGALLVTALFVFNNPLFRTVRFNQLNLWILLFSMSAVLLMEKQQFLAGLAVALGGHIKVYPLIFLVPWGMAKKWRTWLGAIFGALVIFIVQVIPGANGIELWKQYLSFFPRFPQGTYFRDNSLHSLVYNSLRFIGFFGSPGNAEFQIAVRIFTVFLMVAVIVWLCWRYFRVELLFKDSVSRNSRLVSHLMDALAAMLLLAPMVWEHHYVLVIPIVIWAAATLGKRKPAQLVVSAFLMLGMPTFDFFPFSYHRLVGLVWLLILTSPSLLDFSNESLDKIKKHPAVAGNPCLDK